MLTQADSPRLRLNPLSRVPLPLVGGAILGYLLIYIWFELEPKWIFYLFAGLLAAASLPMIAILLKGRLERFFLGLFLFSLQFYLSFNFTASDRAMPGGVQGLNVSLQFLLAVVYFVAWRTRTTIDPGDVRSINRRFLTACLWFLGLSSLSFLNTTTKTYTVYGLFYHVGLVTVALAACHICSSRVGLRALWKAVWAILVTQSLVLLAQRATDISFSLTGELLDSKWRDRFGGTMGAAPVSVATLFMCMVLFSELRLLRGDRREALSWIPAFGLGSLSLLLSLTRSAWVGCGIGSAYLLGWVFRRERLSMIRGSLLSAVALMALIVAYGPVRDRLDANHSHAAEERWRLNYVNLEMIKAHPIIGIGLNTAYDTKASYIPSFFTDGDWIYIAHNQYLLIAAESGIIGLGAFLAVVWIAVVSAAKSAQKADSLVGESGAALFACLLGLIWGMNLDFYGGMQVYVLLWFVFGCAAGVWVLARQEEGGVKEMHGTTESRQALSAPREAVPPAHPGTLLD